MPLNPDVKLPSWATLVKPKSLPASSSSTTTMTTDLHRREPLSTREEEAYMRTRCFHLLSQKMNQAMEEVLEKCLAPSLASLEAFLDASLPNNENQSDNRRDEENRKRPRIGLNTDTDNSNKKCNQHIIKGLDLSLFDQQQNSNKADPLLLPIALLQGPSLGMDRREQMQHLVHSLQKTRTRAAVVSLRSPKREWMSELIRQCHQCYPILGVNDTLRRRIIKRKKKKAITSSDLLLLWAQHVTCMEEIVVFVDADDSLYSAELQDFLHLLAARRAEQGLPVSVILMAPPGGRRTVELRSSLQGYAGFLVKTIPLASTEDILDRFWQHVQHLPVMFPPKVLAAIRSSFVYHHKSASLCLAKFKQALACYFTPKGSFLWAANDKDILKELWQRVAYFFVERRIRPILVGHDIPNHSSEQLHQMMEEADTRHEKVQVVLELLETIRAAKDNPQHATKNLLDPSFAMALRSFSKKDFLKVLVQIRRQIQGLLREGKDTTTGNSQKGAIKEGSASTFRSLFIKGVKCCESLEEAADLAKQYELRQFNRRLDFLNELIVLVGNGRDGDDLSEIEELLDEAIVDWMFRKDTGDDSSTWSALRNECDWDAVTASFMVAEPRRKTVRALLKASQLEGGEHFSLAYVAGTMYHLLHDRVAATQEDWYEEFLQFASTHSREDAGAMFSLGLRYLKQCGLISEKLRVGSRRDIVYERAKLVWCGGD